MTISAEGQAYATRINAPGIGAQAVKSSIKNTLTGIGNYVEENARQTRLANDVILTEPDATLRGNALSDVQSLAAARRVLTEIEGHMRDLAAIVDQITASQATSRARAVQLGAV